MSAAAGERARRHQLVDEPLGDAPDGLGGRSSAPAIQRRGLAVGLSGRPQPSGTCSWRGPQKGVTPAVCRSRDGSGVYGDHGNAGSA